MAAQQLPVPNIANMQAAVSGMAIEGNRMVQNLQTYNAHQQTLTTELSLRANGNVAVMQQLARIQASITEGFALTNAK